MRFLLRLVWVCLLASGLALAAMAHGLRPAGLRGGVYGAGAGVFGVPTGPGRHVLVLYGREDGWPTGRMHAIFAANLVGHFGAARIESFDLYRAGQLGAYDAAIVVGSEYQAPSQALVVDIRAGSRPVIWLGAGVAPVVSGAAQYGWRPGAADLTRPSSVVYRGASLTRDPAGEVLTPPDIVDSGTVAVLATSGGRPWAVRSANLTYVAETPFSYVDEDDRYLAFADLLFDTLAPATPARHRAMVRIEDVGPEADPTRLRHIADLLSARHVPFSVAVYDAYRDPDGHFAHEMPTAFSLRRRPGVVAALKYMVEHGGTLVMHGHTHQSDERPNPYARVSAGDYEFFAAGLGAGGDFLLQGPLAQDDVAAWRARLDQGLADWSDVGLPRPQVFTTPHYAASPNAYAAIRSRFPVRYERVLYFAREAGPGLVWKSGDWGGQFFPYEIRDIRGDLLLPENLGYYAGKGRGYGSGGGFGRGQDHLIDSARRNLVVRDGYASFFFHWFEDPAVLDGTVAGVQAMGYRFVAPAEVLSSAPAALMAPRPAPARIEPTRAWVWLYRLAAPGDLVLLLFVSGVLGLLAEVLVGRWTRAREPA
jgi:uncharacterized protein YdaL